jgi:hypothetical protein
MAFDAVLIIRASSTMSRFTRKYQGTKLTADGPCATRARMMLVPQAVRTRAATCRARLANWRRRALVRLAGYDFRNDARWIEAEAWYKSAKREKGRDYEFLYDFSVARFEYSSDVLHRIDDKADSLFKFSAVLAGALATSLKLSEASRSVVVASVPSFLLFALAIIFAVVAKKPTTTGGPMEIKGAMELNVGEEKGDEERAAAAAQYHSACVGTELAAARKAYWIECATWCIVGAIIALTFLAFA